MLHVNSVETKISVISLCTGTGIHCKECQLGHAAEKVITAALKYWYKDKSVFQKLAKQICSVASVLARNKLSFGCLKISSVTSVFKNCSVCNFPDKNSFDVRLVNQQLHIRVVHFLVVLVVAQVTGQIQTLFIYTGQVQTLFKYRIFAGLSAVWL